MSWSRDVVIAADPPRIGPAGCLSALPWSLATWVRGGRPQDSPREPRLRDKGSLFSGFPARTAVLGRVSESGRGQVRPDQHRYTL